MVKRKFELLALTETKLKENREIPRCGVNYINAGARETERARKVWHFFMNDMWHSAGTDFGFVSSRAPWVKVCEVVMHGLS